MPGHRTCYFYSLQGLEEILPSSKPGFLFLSSHQNFIENAFKRQTSTSKTGTPDSTGGIDSLLGQQMPVPYSDSFDSQELRDSLDFRSGNWRLYLPPRSIMQRRISTWEADIQQPASFELLATCIFLLFFSQS